MRVERQTRRFYDGCWVMGLLFVIGLGLVVAAFQSGGAGAQLRDAPMGWDMWGDPPEWVRPKVWVPDRMSETLRWRLSRHRALIEGGIPEPYHGARNPLTETPATLREGSALYAENCASCHDPSGSGRGDAGLALYPSPALLSYLIETPMAVDGYLLWAIAEGGQPFGSSMPAFQDALSREQIWQIVTYMRAGFPPIPEATAE
jgi:cytochrome c553